MVGLRTGFASPQRPVLIAFLHIGVLLVVQLLAQLHESSITHFLVISELLDFLQDLLLAALLPNIVQLLLYGLGNGPLNKIGGTLGIAHHLQVKVHVAVVVGLVDLLLQLFYAGLQSHLLAVAELNQLLSKGVGLLAHELGELTLVLHR